MGTVRPSQSTMMGVRGVFLPSGEESTLESKWWLIEIVQ